MAIDHPLLKDKDKKKKRIWKSNTADLHFSKFIVNRDGKCLRCGSVDNLTNSHYWRRGHSGTRYLPDNCITLCQRCHSLWENLKNEDYMEFMVHRIGRKRYDEVEIMARKFKKRSDAVAECMKLLEVIQ